MRLLIGGTALALVGLSLGLRARRRTAEPPRYRPRPIGLMAVTGGSLAAHHPLFFLCTEHNCASDGPVVPSGPAPLLAAPSSGAPPTPPPCPTLSTRPTPP